MVPNISFDPPLIEYVIPDFGFRFGISQADWFGPVRSGTFWFYPVRSRFRTFKFEVESKSEITAGDRSISHGLKD